MIVIPFVLYQNDENKMGERKFKSTKGTRKVDDTVYGVYAYLIPVYTSLAYIKLMFQIQILFCSKFILLSTNLNMHFFYTIFNFLLYSLFYYKLSINIKKEFVKVEGRQTTFYIHVM